MTRTLIRNLASKANQTVTVRGWLHKKRLLGGLNFITLRDRSGLAQSLIEDKNELEKLRGLQIGSVVALTGVVSADDRAPGGIELHNVAVEVEVPVTDEPPIEIDKSISHKSENLDTLFDNRVIGLRNSQEQNVFKIQAGLTKALREYFYRHDFVEIHTPKLLAEATEGGAEVFRLEYFDKTATLAQSPQFYKQIMVGAYERVFEIAPVYRAEPSATTRHMTEYTSVDGELGFIDLDDLKSFLSGLLHYVTKSIWSDCETELKSWNATKPLLPKEIPTVAMSEIHTKYSQATGENTVGEKDLRPDEERWVCEYAKKNLASESVFVSEWPASEMKFYHQANEADPTKADRVDLLFRGVEIATVSMREYRYNMVLKQLKKFVGSDSKDHPGFKPLLTSMKYGMPPHGGFGLGLERLTQKLIGLANVKEATLFPRDINRLTP
jgi:nondiscriminating aspartyl-tRNA synthetase